MYDPQISVAKLCAILAWLPVVPALVASWLLDVPALAGLGVCCAMVGCTFVILRDGNRTRSVVRVLSAPAPNTSNTVRGLR